MSTCTKMLASCLLVSTMAVLARAQGNEYLPPNKGYNYDTPTVPFPTSNNANRQPTQPPFRPSAPPQRPTYIPPPAGPSPNSGHENHDDHHHEPGMPFDFAYAVNEGENNYSHNAASDGDVTRGEYRVAMPDGRTQIVKYTADWKNGFNAEVTYEGEASYPDQAQGYGRGAPAAPAGGNQAYLPPNQGYQY